MSETVRFTTVQDNTILKPRIRRTDFYDRFTTVQDNTILKQSDL